MSFVCVCLSCLCFLLFPRLLDIDRSLSSDQAFVQATFRNRDGGQGHMCRYAHCASTIVSRLVFRNRLSKPAVIPRSSRRDAVQNWAHRPKFKLDPGPVLLLLLCGELVGQKVLDRPLCALGTSLSCEIKQRCYRKWCRQNDAL